MPGMPSRLPVVVTLDGEVRDPAQPLLFADDLAAVRGDGVFETLLVRDGRACLVESHLRRLVQSAKMMDLPEPDLPAWRRRDRGRGGAVDGRGPGRGRAAPGVQPRPGERLGADRLSDGQSVGGPGGGDPPRRSRRGAAGSRAAGHRRRCDAVAAGRCQDVVVRGEHGRPAARRRQGRRRRDLRQHRRVHSRRAAFDGRDRRRRATTGPGAPASTPRRRGIRSCAAPPSRRCSRSPATRATTATTRLCDLRICLPRKEFGWYRASPSRRGCTPWTAGCWRPPRWRRRWPDWSTRRSSAIAEREKLLAHPCLREYGQPYTGKEVVRNIE